MLSTLERLRPPWHRWALCRGRVGLFYDSSPTSVAISKAICSKCGCRAVCLLEALEEEAGEWRPIGVRGGLSANERAALVEPRPPGDEYSASTQQVAKRCVT